MPITRATTWYFSPDDDALGALLATARTATVSLHALIYSFNSPELAQVFLDAHQKGIVVGIVADHTQSTTPSERPVLQRLVDAGVDVVISAAATGHILHSKVLLIDQELGSLSNSSTVAWGSFNQTDVAQKENNVLEVTTDPSLCERCWQAYQAARAFGLTRPQWQIAPTGATDAAHEGLSTGIPVRAEPPDAGGSP